MSIKLFIKLLCFAIISFTLSYIGYTHFDSEFKVNRGRFLKFIHENNYQTHDESVSFVGADTLIVNSINHDVEFRKSKNNDGKVLITTNMGTNKPLHVIKSNGSVALTLKESTSKYQSTLTVYVPNQIKAIEVRNKNGDIALSELTLNRLTTSNVNGDITVWQVNINTASLNNINGDLKLEKNSNINELLAKTINGDIALDINHHFMRYQLNSVTGDINIVSTVAFNSTLEVNPKNALPNSTNIIYAHTVSGDLNIKSI